MKLKGNHDHDIANVKERVKAADPLVQANILSDIACMLTCIIDQLIIYLSKVVHSLAK